MSSLTLFGARRWGTALSAHLADAGRDVTLWVRRPDIADDLNRTRRHPRCLPDVSLPSSIRITADLQTAAEASTMWGMAIPASYMREVAEQLTPFTHDDVTVASMAKGFDQAPLMTMSQVLSEVFDAVPDDQIGALLGPSHAEEVAQNFPTTIVAAAPSDPVAEQIQRAFMTDYLRVYFHTDLIGVEVGTTTKHVIAIATGISDGVGYGENVKATLITRGLAEIRRLGQAVGGDPETFSGLTGFGDLIATCISEHSRNRRFGKQVGTGKSPEAVQDEMETVVEGIHTTRAVYGLADKYDLEMPITTAVHSVLSGRLPPSKMVDQVMTRSPNRENWLPKHLRDAASESTFSTPLSADESDSDASG